MKTLFVCVLGALLAVPATAFADAVCAAAVNRAIAATVTATGTLAAATKYSAAHSDLCDGTWLAYEQQDGAAVDHAWNEAITAQSQCGMDANASVQLGKLIVSLHARRIRIDNETDKIGRECR